MKVVDHGIGIIVGDEHKNVIYMTGIINGVDQVFRFSASFYCIVTSSGLTALPKSHSFYGPSF